jgi:hypothetical protein
MRAEAYAERHEEKRSGGFLMKLSPVWALCSLCEKKGLKIIYPI